MLIFVAPSLYLLVPSVAASPPCCLPCTRWLRRALYAVRSSCGYANPHTAMRGHIGDVLALTTHYGFMQATPGYAWAHFLVLDHPEPGAPGNSTQRSSHSAREKLPTLPWPWHWVYCVSTARWYAILGLATQLIRALNY